MSKYIVQHRRGTAAQWSEKDTIIPMEGELVIEIDEENAQHKLKIGDGIHTYAELAYLQAGDEVITQALAKALPRVITITLDVDQWSEVTSESDPNLGYYKQTVTLDGITARSRLDLQPNVDMLAEFQSLNLVFTTENKNGVITVYSVGDMPLKSYTMQATIVETEVIVESEKVVGMPIGTPTTKADWAQTDETKSDYIKNKPEVLDGVSCTHEWNGTILTVTSASGTSSADLKGVDGVSGVYVGDGEMPDGYNVQIDPNGMPYTYNDLKGAPGKDGVTPKLKTEDSKLYVSYDYGNTWEYLQDIQQGTGSGDGQDGVGIYGIEKTSSEGLVDTYTITYTDGTVTTFTVTNGKDGDNGHTPVITIQDGNWYIDGEDSGVTATGSKGNDGNGISDISKTSTNEFVDTYTITFTDNSTTTFTVTNGKDGDPFTYNDFTEEQLKDLKGEPGYTPQKDVDYFDGDDGVGVDSVKIENGVLFIKYTNSTDYIELGGVKGEDGVGIAEVYVADGYLYVRKTNEDTATQLAYIKGDPFTYEDFTEEQLADLKGEKGNPGTYDDFTEAEKTELINDILNALPTWEGGSY